MTIDGRMEAAEMENELTKSPLTDEEARKVSGGRAGMVLHPWPKCQTPYMVPRLVLEFGLKLPSCPRCTLMAAKGENP